MGFSSKGTALQIGDGASPEVFTTVAELTKVDPPKFGTGTVETTSHDSTAKEYVSDGIQDHGETAIEGNWLPNHATHGSTAGLLKKAKDGALSNWRIVVTPGSGSTFTTTGAAFCTFEPKAGAPTDKLSFSGSLKWSGAVTIS